MEGDDESKLEDLSFEGSDSDSSSEVDFQEAERGGGDYDVYAENDLAADIEVLEEEEEEEDGEEEGLVSVAVFGTDDDWREEEGKAEEGRRMGRRGGGGGEIGC